MSRAQRLPQAQRRSQLVAVATEVFAESGYRTASMDDVAEAAGVSKPVLYQHFDSKQALYLAVIDAAAEVFDGILTQALHSTEDNEERVAATFSAYFSFVIEHRPQFTVVFRSDSYEPAAEQKVNQVRRLSAERIAQVISENTMTTPAEASLLGQSIIGMAERSALQFVSGPELDAASTARLMTYFLWRGISSFPTSEDESERHGGSTRPWELE
ncbi:TetR/AcrR family transcriptional regulator [Brevibacterium daeguense]|uniref:TetR/AcrR family transcriptional regulator n=1 Tax=Brevibacterium daeguense TaxID=909936 RepID=A0ABP8EJD2_9MICO|nr:TetR/AcrR family transcriptional regulator [Brevibacterium daeguense]